MQKKILVIEDNLDIQDNIVEILELANYKVYSASNGKVGVVKAKDIIPDLIICDIMMPEMDGYEVLYLIEKDPVIASTPFIFLTAKTEKDDFRKGMNLGADDYLTKPFEDMDLLNTIEKRISKAERLVGHKNTTSTGNLNLAKILDLPNLNYRTFKKKDVIFREGDNANLIYILKSGKVKTTIQNSHAKEYTTGLYCIGDIFGHETSITQQFQKSTAIAIEDTEIATLTKDLFLTLLEENNTATLELIKMVSTSNQQKNEELLNLAYNSVRKRVADCLLLLNSKYRADKAHENLTVSREDLASMAGTSKETVIRVLSDFKSENLIEIKASKIKLLTIETLQNLRN